jgi:predicted permease
MEALWQDVRFGARTLRKNPAFTAAAALSLALGIGVNTTIFTLVNAVFLNPLPVERASELVGVFTVDERNPGALTNLLQTSRLNYLDYRDKTQAFSALTAYLPGLAVSLSLGAEPEQAQAELVTGNYFDTLGVKPAIGRTFRADEDLTPGASPVAVLSHGLWQRKFGGSPDVLGRSLNVNGVPFTVVGVTPEGFKGVNALVGPDLWVPSMMYRTVLPAQFLQWFEDRRALLFSIAGRLKPGATIASAEAECKALAKALEQEYPQPNQGRSITLRPITEISIFPGLRDALVLGSIVLMAVVGLVLLIACSNVANLLLARASARRQEIAVRLAIGASRWRLVRQLLTESVLLGLAGGVLGFIFAGWARDGIWAARPAVVPQNFVAISLDGRVMLFTLGVSLVTALVFGLVPALQSSRPGVIEAIKEESRSAGRSRHRVTLGNGLVVFQVALSLVALIAAGLFLRSIQRAYAIDPGFATKDVAVLLVGPGQQGYDQPRSERFYRDVKERLQGVAGVRSVAWAGNAPLFGGFMRSVFIEGREEDKERSGILTLTNTVDPGYFATTDTALLRGRDFSDQDRPGSVPVVIVNEAFAKKFYPNEEALGRRFRFYGDTAYHEIVGVVETVKYNTVGEPPTPCVFVPLAQNYADAMVLYVRSAGEIGPILGAARTEIRALDSQVPIILAFTVGEVIDQSLWAPKFAASLLGIFGLLALALASVGLYGVLAYAVTQRRREIGVRMALGAEQTRVLHLVLRDGLTLVGLGVALGLAVALGLSGTVVSLLYGVGAVDPASFLGAAAVLVAVAAVASYLPARRASRIDPIVALREA